MSAVTLERAGGWREHAEPAAPPLFDDLGGEPTLDEVIAGVWEGLAAHGAATCPVCGSELRPDCGALSLQPDDPDAAQDAEAGSRVAPRPDGGRCLGCDSTLR